MDTNSALAGRKWAEIGAKILMFVPLNGPCGSQCGPAAPAARLARRRTARRPRAGLGRVAIRRLNLRKPASNPITPSRSGTLRIAVRSLPKFICRPVEWFRAHSIWTERGYLLHFLCRWYKILVI